MTNDTAAIHLGGTAKRTKDVRLLHKLGLKFAEIPINDPGRFGPLVEKYSRLKDNLGLYYVCHGVREGDPNDMAALEKDYFPKIIDILPLMNRLGMTLLTIHLWMDRRYIEEEVFAFKIDLLKRILERATDAGITVCIENLSESASDLKVPFDELSRLNMTLDLGHAQLLTTFNRSFEFMDQFPDRIKHVHLHDNEGGHSYRDDLHLPPGEGIIDLKKIFEKLKEIGYARTITLELTPKEIKRCLAYVKELTE
jgi:sugar phosphate isomerase/epimerase